MRSIIFNNQLLIETFNKGIPIYLYGKGTYSKIVESELRKFGVKSSGNIVDDLYFNKSVSFDSRWSLLNDYEDTTIIKRSDLDKFNFDYAVVLGINGKFELFENINCVNTFFVDGMLGDAWSDFSISWLKSNHYEIEQVIELLDIDSVKVYNAFINRRLNFTNDTDSFSEKLVYYNDLIDLNRKHTVLDCGAYTGDNLIDFFALNNQSTYICFEPDKKNYNEILELVREKSYKNVIVHNIGVSDKQNIVKFKSNQGLTSIVSDEGDSEIHVDAIDNVIDFPVSIIKMDVEGQELSALHGAQYTIKKYLPILLISLYHKPSDLYTIPLYINKLSNQYSFKLLQHYTDPSTGTPLTDLVLYCLPKIK